MSFKDLTKEEHAGLAEKGHQKYSKDGPFADPLIRCDGCQKILLTEETLKEGICPCGNTRVRNLTSLKDKKELDILCDFVDSGKVDPQFAALLIEVQA